MQPTRTLLVLLLLTVLAPAVLACQRSAADGRVTVELQSIEPSPPVVGPAVLYLRLRDTNGRPVTGLQSIQVEGTMTHAGMKPVIVEAHEREDGVYVTQGFSFTMAGDWIVIARGSWQGRPFEASTTLAGVRPASLPTVTPTHDRGNAMTPTP
ncbi:MAG: FixH family protein [Thermomicrobium sp.]|nr:FixH family protein [Thermomicrobium sp.]